MSSYIELHALLNHHESRCKTTGFSGVQVYHLPDLRAYLKIGRTAGSTDLAREFVVLKWLSTRLNVPSPLDYAAEGGMEALLISQVAGSPASELMGVTGMTVARLADLIKIAARSLRGFHDLPIDECSLERRLDTRFALARRNVELGLLSETDEEFASEHGGKLPLEIYDDLLGMRPTDEDLVFTHGDPSMPNVILDGPAVGFIDLDGAGVADRYADIAIFIRSVAWNCSLAVDIEPVFCIGYGVDELDRHKLDFYTLMDDLF